MRELFGPFIYMHIGLQIGCLVKVIRHWRKINWYMAWLVIYHEMMCFLSAYIMFVPSTDEVVNVSTAYYPGEFFFLAFVPLLFIGIGLKGIFLCMEKQTSGRKWSNMIGAICYVGISGLPIWFTWCLVIGRFFEIQMWQTDNLLRMVILTVVLPLVPSIVGIVRKYIAPSDATRIGD
ncbi:MAG: hypothetical protein ACRCWY_04985 [Cellulosilyticaceae bacterium]